MPVGLALVAGAIESVVGYPDLVFRFIGHPVTWMARLIAWGDERWNSENDSDLTQRLQGGALVLLLLAVSLIAGLLITRLCYLFLPAIVAFIVVAVLASTLIAQRSLDAHVTAVADALASKGLDAGREAVAMIVGRDTRELDETGVARAAIESLAESFSDGIVGPIFWLAVAGLPGAIAYKAINTADSMIGHKTPKYIAFGWAAARTDDLVNLPASRLSVLWIALAALWVPDLSALGALRAAWRDASRHDSPNAGWPEAAMAGALGLTLGGTSSYEGEVVRGPTFGTGRSALKARDIRTALSLYRAACGFQLAVLLVLALLTWLL